MAVQQPNSAPAPAPAPVSAPVQHYAAGEEGSYNFRATAVARFLGKLLGASSQSAFVHAIYQVSGVFVAPFTGIFGDTGNKTNTFETASLVALVVYAVIGWGIVVLIRIITAPKGTRPASS